MLNWKIWSTKKQPEITIGGQTMVAQPMNLERTLQLAFLLAPYIALLEQYWPEFTDNLKKRRGRPRLLSALVRTLAGEMQQTPGDIVTMVAILLDRPVDWVAGNARPAEIVRALPVWDEVNDFALLVESVKHLGLRIDA